MLNVKALKDKIKNSQFRTNIAFANKLGISKQGLQKILNSGQTKEETYMRICSLLDCAPEEIADEEYLDLLIKRKSLETKTGIADRIHELILALEIKDADFCRITQIPPSTLSTVYDRDSCNLSFIQKVLNSITDVSADWLCTGRGEMFISDKRRSLTGDPAAKYGTLMKTMADMEDAMLEMKKKMAEMEKKLKK